LAGWTKRVKRHEWCKWEHVDGHETGVSPKLENRNPKSETNSKSELKNVKKRMACFGFVIFLRFDCEIQITVPLFPNASAASLPWQIQQ
jgi:hypothetical protein